MATDAQVLAVPFPNGLMSTARSPLAMPKTHGRSVVNMLLGADGMGVKRYGFSALADGAGAAVMGVFGYVYAGQTQLLVALADGRIRLRDGSGWADVWTGLNTAGVVRAVAFADKLFFCNGHDPVLVWDGATMAVVEEWVVDKGANLTFVAANRFRIDSDMAFWPVGTKVRARLGGVTYVESVVSAVTQSGAQTNVTLVDSVLTSALDQVSYGARPPAFGFLYAAHDRLWGGSVGGVGAGFSASVDRHRVFYTFGVNDGTAWHDADGVVPSIGLQDKSSGQDELVAMAVRDGVTLFFGKRTTQLWTGTNPDTDGDFGWQRTLPVGVPHPALVVELPNDILFVNANGARTLSRALQTEQLEVSDVGSEVDPTLQDLMRGVLADGAAFGRLCHGRCDAQGFWALRLGDACVVFQIAGKSVGWVMFEGIPAAAQVLTTLPDGRLLAAVGEGLFVYDSATYADDGAPVRTLWQTPWLAYGPNKRWANQQVEVVTGVGAKIPLTLRRTTDVDDGTVVESAVVARTPPDRWGQALWDNGLWDTTAPAAAWARDVFVADVVAYAVESADVRGPLEIFGLKLYGKGER